MFRGRRAPDAETTDWPTLLSLLEGTFASQFKVLTSSKGREVLASDGALWGKNVVKDSDKASGIFKALSSQPDGSRGEVGVQWKMGGGHSIAYEIVRGRPVIFDTQTGQKFTSASDITKHYNLDISQAAYTRLDNVSLNEDFLMRWAK